MELWIRSQDKLKLEKAQQLVCRKSIDDKGDKYFEITNIYTLGIYKTKERALEVLDDIQNKMINGSFGRLINGLGELKNVIPNPIYIYEMPEE